jgi:hypothetical protein
LWRRRSEITILKNDKSAGFCQTAIHAGLNIPFLCTETHELGEEIVASYLYQIHLYDWLETNEYGRFLVDKDL